MSAQYVSEIHKLLKIGGPSDDQAFRDIPEGLPVAPDHTPAGVLVEPLHTPATHNITSSKMNWKAVLVYPIVFVLAFLFFFGILNFTSILAQVQGFFAPPQAQQILGTDSAAYYKWISNYFYAVGDAKLLEPTNDMDKDGLANYDEFILQTNPIVADSDSDGFSDGIEIMNSANPWGLGVMTASQKKLVEKLDIIMINNRISYNVSTNHTQIVEDKITDNYDLERAGSLSIPKLKLTVPLVWSKDPTNFDADLTKGVIHYPGTSLPGENGIVYVSGHSSDYIWKRDPMANIFSRLNFLTAGDDVFVDVYGKDGKVYNFRYQVTTSHVYKPDDQAQFIDSSNQALLNLSTCWPIGTSKDRIVVSAVPVGL